jgi:hypothetical protein
MLDLYALMGGSYSMTTSEKRLEDVTRDVHKMEPVAWNSNIGKLWIWGSANIG